MRLKNYEIDSIKQIAINVFGKNTAVILFGSRINDNIKGGDIDLYIKTANKNNLLDKKIDFLIKLKSKIGEQKIDVVIGRDESRLIEKEALTNGIEL